MKIKIVTDSTADLSPEEIAQHEINVIPLTIEIDGQSYVDGVTIQPESFLELMRKSIQLPKSSQPSVGAFKQLYDELGADGSSIISIHMTSGMSGTVQSAQAAAELSTSDVTVVDSQYISHALSFQVLKAAELAAEGASKEDILEVVEDVRKKSALYVVVDVLDNLVKGGRIGKGKAMVGSLLNIKPIATLQDGVYTPIGKARSHKQVVSQLMSAFKKETAGKIIQGIGISHANGLAMAEPLKKLLEDSGITNVKLTFTTPIISTHTGEGAIGFMYYIR